MILSGAHWTDLYINWMNPDNYSIIVQVFINSKSKPLAIAEILTAGTIFEFETFRFFSLAGSPSLWNLEADDGKN